MAGKINYNFKHTFALPDCIQKLTIGHVQRNWSIKWSWSWRKNLINFFGGKNSNMHATFFGGKIQICNIYLLRIFPSLIQSAKSIELFLSAWVTLRIHLIIKCSLFNDLWNYKRKIYIRIANLIFNMCYFLSTSSSVLLEVTFFLLSSPPYPPWIFLIFYINYRNSRIELI